MSKVLLALETDEQDRDRKARQSAERNFRSEMRVAASGRVLGGPGVWWPKTPGRQRYEQVRAERAEKARKRLVKAFADRAIPSPPPAPTGEKEEEGT